jgi:hypothetical protein
MSIEVVSWALNLAPTPTDANGKPNDSCAFVLVGLANHAAPDGTGAFPAVRTLMRYTRLSERTVRTALARLEDAGLIRPCDPDLIAARIKRADRRPRGWDLAIDRIRDDLTADDLTALEHQFPGLTARLAAQKQPATPAGRPSGHSPKDGYPQDVDNHRSGEQRLHPAVDSPAHEVHSPHPAQGTGCNERTNGVQRAQSRGAVVAPEPYKEPPEEPPPPRARDSARADAASAGGGAAEFFDQLIAGWPLSRGQRRRLAPAIVTALTAGWSSAELAQHVGANTDGVRNAYAVLHSRLGDLPGPPPRTKLLTRPAWCGHCHPDTRHLEDADGDDRGRCPRCHPLGQPSITPAGLASPGPDHENVTALVEPIAGAR